MINKAETEKHSKLEKVDITAILERIEALEQENIRLR